MSTYTTGEVAKLCGVSVRTVQYYDTRGILVPGELSEGGRRLYSQEDLEKMKLICFLRELDLSLDSIKKLLKEANSEKVISLILKEQEKMLWDEITEKEEKLLKLRELQSLVKKKESLSVESIQDVAHSMENKNQAMEKKMKLKKMRTVLLCIGIPMFILQVGSIVLWIMSGIWWPFAVIYGAAIPAAILISRYYFNSVGYICPECEEEFLPSFKEMFWANHTLTTRKLTCPHCHHKGFCVETYHKRNKQ